MFIKYQVSIYVILYDISFNQQNNTRYFFFNLQIREIRLRNINHVA